MAFERFLSTFGRRAADGPTCDPWANEFALLTPGFAELSRKFAGRTFENGLYRVHDSRSGPEAVSLIAQAFPDFTSRAVPFGFDWLGRQFALDRDRLVAGQPQVLMLEVGSGEALEIPQTLIGFHDEDLVEYRDAALAERLFAEWCAANSGNATVPFAACVGYRIHLCLGGSDAVANLELIDLDVYWSICAQLRQGTIALPPDTSIAEITRRMN